MAHSKWNSVPREQRPHSDGVWRKPIRSAGLASSTALPLHRRAESGFHIAVLFRTGRPRSSSPAPPINRAGSPNAGLMSPRFLDGVTSYSPATASLRPKHKGFAQRRKERRAGRACRSLVPCFRPYAGNQEMPLRGFTAGSANLCGLCVKPVFLQRMTYR